MRGGRIVGSGPTDEVLTPDLLRDVFGVEVAIREHPTLPGKTIALPYARRHDGTAPASDLVSDLAAPTSGDVESPHAAT